MTESQRKAVLEWWGRQISHQYNIYLSEGDIEAIKIITEALQAPQPEVVRVYEITEDGAWQCILHKYDGGWAESTLKSFRGMFFKGLKAVLECHPQGIRIIREKSDEAKPVKNYGHADDALFLGDK